MSYGIWMSCIIDGDGLSTAFTDYVQQYMTDQRYPTTANFTPLPNSTYKSYVDAIDSQHDEYVTLKPVLQQLQGVIDSFSKDQGANAKVYQDISSQRDKLYTLVESYVDQGRKDEMAGLPSCGATGASPKPHCCPEPDSQSGEVPPMTDVIPGVYCDGLGCRVLKPMQTGPWNVDGALGGNIVVYEMNNQCQLEINDTDKSCGDTGVADKPCSQFTCGGTKYDLLQDCNIELVPNKLGLVPTVTFTNRTCAPMTPSPHFASC